MTFLHISIVWDGPAKPPEQLKGILALATDWISLGPTLYVIYTNEDVFVWQDRFRAVAADSDSFLITEIANTTWTGGWMPKAFWAWLRKDRSTPFGASAPYLPPPRY